MKALLIDDHPLFRGGIKRILELHEKDCEVLEVGTCDAAIETLRRHNDIALILLDLGLPGMNGIDGLASLRSLNANAPIVIMSASDSPAIIRKSLDLGAKGFIPKSATPDVILNAIKLVLSGGMYIPNQLLAPDPGADESADDIYAKFKLTPRQVEVVDLMVKGFSNKEIARKMDLSDHTVRGHLSQIFAALNVNNRTEAAFVINNLMAQMNG